MTNNDHLLNFIIETNWSQLPNKVRHQSKRCLLDTLGALIAGHQTPVAEIMASFAQTQFPGNESTVLVKGHKISDYYSINDELPKYQKRWERGS
jgi:2-methylcitrate dehydratase PrpD